MVNDNRLGLSDRQKFAVVVLVLFGLFVIFFGTGMSSPEVGSLGGAIGVLVPSLIVVASKRSSNQRYVFARAQVLRATAQPITGARKGQCHMLLFVHAPGIDSVEVLVKDPDVPINTWPYPGAELPVLIPNGNPRRIKVLWEQVHSEADLAPTDYFYDSENDTDEFPTQRSAEPTTEAYQPTSGYEPPQPSTSTEAGDAPERPAQPRRKPSPWPRRPADTVVTGDTVVVAHAPVPRAPADDSELILRATQTPEAKPPAPARESEVAQGGVVAQAEPPAVENDASPDAATPTKTADQITPPTEDAAPTQADPSAGPEEPAPEQGRAGDAFLAAYLGDGPPMAKAPAVDHGLHGVSITLIVSNLERSLAFYRDTVGLVEIDSGSGSAVLASGQARIMLRQVPDMRPVDRRVAHLNLEVDDVHGEYDRLKAAGVEFGHRPRVVTRGEQLEQWAATFRDPDGHAVTLTRWETRP